MGGHCNSDRFFGLYRYDCILNSGYTVSMKLLLHGCCAPCSIQCVEAIAEEGIAPDLFWYNPNIHPFTEYRSRRDSFRLLADKMGLALIEEDEYGLRAFIKGMPHLDDVNAGDAGQCKNGEGSRCAYCYRRRLEKAAAVAAEKGCDAYSTTLLISPYQNHYLIRETGEELAAIHHIDFYYRDFRPRFREGQNRARAEGYYMQKYCGCIFSEEERYLEKRYLEKCGPETQGK